MLAFLAEASGAADRARHGRRAARGARGGGAIASEAEIARARGGRHARAAPTRPPRSPRRWNGSFSSWACRAPRSRSSCDPSPELGATGAERVELRLSPSPGQKAASLAKTASGGELSRTMLACRSVMADLDDVPTLVFDEVDAGIGGEAGLAVGRRLARLAEGPSGAGGDAPSPDRLLRRPPHPGREGVAGPRRCACSPTTSASTSSLGCWRVSRAATGPSRTPKSSWRRRRRRGARPRASADRARPVGCATTARVGYPP